MRNIALFSLLLFSCSLFSKDLKKLVFYEFLITDQSDTILARTLPKRIASELDRNFKIINLDFTLATEYWDNLERSNDDINITDTEWETADYRIDGEITSTGISIEILTIGKGITKSIYVKRDFDKDPSNKKIQEIARAIHDKLNSILIKNFANNKMILKTKIVEPVQLIVIEDTISVSAQYPYRI